MHYQNNKWQIIEFTLDEVSTVSGYKKQFNRIITNKGVDYLLSLIERNIEEKK